MRIRIYIPGSQGNVADGWWELWSPEVVDHVNKLLPGLIQLEALPPKDCPYPLEEPNHHCCRGCIFWRETLQTCLVAEEDKKKKEVKNGTDTTNEG